MRDNRFTIQPQIVVAYLLLAAVIFAIVAGAVIGSHKYVVANTIPIGELHANYQAEGLAGATKLEAEIIPAFGSITLAGGTDQLLEVRSVSNIADMRPDVDYQVVDGVGILQMQPTVPAGLPNLRKLDVYRNDWNLRLNSDIPMDLTIEVGMGNADLDLRGLSLTYLEVDVGTGITTIDLRGAWTDGYDVYIEGGSGTATVLLPDDVGVNVVVEEGVGHFSQSGLTKEGDFYTNSVDGEPDVVINIEVEVGLGAVHMEVGDEELVQ